MTAEATLPRQMCARVSWDQGEDPIGTAPGPPTWLLLEVPPPWPRVVAEAAGLPPGLLPVLAEAAAAGHDAQLLGLTPDPAYTAAGLTRLLVLTRPDPPFARYRRAEYVAPTTQVAALVADLARATLGVSSGVARHAALADADLAARYRVPPEAARDILVCTHGTRDACCATLGFPLYRALREAAPAGVRVWRSSHVGGHRFAPTLVDLPTARAWAHLRPEHVPDLLSGWGPAPDLDRHYRGWGGAPTAVDQVAERAAFARHGWAWADHAVETALLDGGDDAPRSVVRVVGRGPGDVGGVVAYLAVVERGDPVLTLGSTGDGPLEPVDQFRLASLTPLDTTHMVATR